MMRLIGFVVGSIVALTLLGCGEPTTPMPSPPPRIGIHLSPASLGQSVSLQQRLTIEKGDRTDELDAAIEVDAHRIDFVGLAMGQRVMSLHDDGKTVQSWRHPRLPEQVQAENVLEDLQLTFWPAEAIRGALPAGWRLEEQGRERSLFFGQDKVMTVVYSGEPRWVGTIELTNLRYGYRLVIDSVTTAP